MDSPAPSQPGRGLELRRAGLEVAEERGLELREATAEVLLQALGLRRELRQYLHPRLVSISSWSKTAKNCCRAVEKVS